MKSYLEERVAAPGLENWEYGRGDPLRCPRDNLYPQKLALTSPTSCDRSVGIVRLRTKATEFGYYHCTILLGNYLRSVIKQQTVSKVY
jgi:hypothetical protein